MKHKTPGVTDELLMRAKEEFLEMGFQGANLRRIATAAGVSTNSIYGRFGDKEGLFDAIVKETAENFASLIAEKNRLSEADQDPESAMERSGRDTLETLDYVYDHFDIFKLIFCKSAGTRYEHFIDQISEAEEQTYRLYIEQNGLAGKVSDLFVHEVCQSGYRYLIETVANDLTREEAHKFMSEVIVYTAAGFEAVLGQ